MSDKILQVIDPDGEIKEQLQAIRENFLTLQKDSLKGAAQVVGFTPLGANQVVSSTSYVSIGLKTSITTSGGLVMLFGVTGMEFDAGATVAVQVTLDGEVKAQGKGEEAVQPTITLVWAGTVGAGVHVIDMQYKALVNPVTITGDLNNSTVLIAVEFII